jgi:Flp pilus assembly pilin Flp
MRMWERLNCKLACAGLRFVARRNSGQATVEYLLIMGSVAAMLTIFGVMFHKKIIGGIFTLIGLVIGTSNSSGSS